MIIKNNMFMLYTFTDQSDWITRPRNCSPRMSTCFSVSFAGMISGSWNLRRLVSSLIFLAMSASMGSSPSSSSAIIMEDEANQDFACHLQVVLDATTTCSLPVQHPKPRFQHGNRAILRQHFTAKPPFNVPRFTGSLDLPGLNSIPRKQALCVNQCQMYPDIPCFSIYRA